MGTIETSTGFRAWIERNDVEVIIAALALILTSMVLLFDKITAAQWLTIFALVLGYIFGKR